MIRRWTVIVAAMLAALGHAVPLPAQTANERIVAVGDLHGDYSAWLTIARASRLVDTDNKWAAGKTIFVQTGDVTDRGPDSLKIIRHLQKLEREARAAGGKVIVLLGNHEAMQVTGDLRYVHPGEYAAFANRQSERRRAAAFEANKERISEYFLARDPSLSPEAIEAEWLKETPLGKVEHDTAWSPKGDLGQMGGTATGGCEGWRHIVRTWRNQRPICLGPDGRDQSPGEGRDRGWRCQSGSNHQ